MQEYQSQEITKLAKALISVQEELQPAVKDATNPFDKNRYASPKQCQKASLMEAGFRWSPSRKVWWKYADVV